MSSYPALDFLRKVEVWQHAPGGTAGLAVALPEDDEVTLAGLLAKVRMAGPATFLEAQARYWLVGYRETNPPLTAAQRTELDEVIAGLPAAAFARPPAGRGSSRSSSRNRSRIITSAVVAVVALLAGIGTKALVSGGHDNSPPAAGAPVNPVRQPAQGGPTDLQRFRADWKVPAAAQASAGNSQVQVVLLQDGLYYPAPFGLPAGDPGWTADSTGSVTASVHGGLADVTDNDGITWTVLVTQPFALSSNPQAVFRVLRDAAVQSMPEPHAIAVRFPAVSH